MPLFFWFDLFLEARAEILEKVSLVFWEIWRHQKDILKLTDPLQNLELMQENTKVCVELFQQLLKKKVTIKVYSKDLASIVSRFLSYQEWHFWLMIFARNFRKRFFWNRRLEIRHLQYRNENVDGNNSAILNWNRAMIYLQ